MTPESCVPNQRVQPPPAQGVRIDWLYVPEHVRRAVEAGLGSAITDAITQPTGFTPGVAARVRTASGRRLFIKAAGPEPNPDLPTIHRREGRIVAALPANAPVPRLLWSFDEGDRGWIVLVFEEVDGRMPAQPWLPTELNHALDALVELHTALTPSPLPPNTVSTAIHEFTESLCGWRRLQTEAPSRIDGLDGWSMRHLDALAELEAAAPAAVDGNTLLHFDTRADNMLLTADRVWFVDWPLACTGAAWVDVMFFAPSVTMQGGPSPEEVCSHHPAYRAADPAALTAAIAATAGFFTHRSLQPPPPGLPTVRAFQAAQGIIARRWLAQRTGWE